MEIAIILLKQDTTQKNIGVKRLLNSPIITYFILYFISSITLNFENEASIENYISYIIYCFRLLYLKYLDIKEKDYKSRDLEFNLEKEFYLGYKDLVTNRSNNYFEELTQLRFLTR